MNKWIGVGRLTQDPEVRYTQDGKAVASFTIAVNKFGGGEQKANFIPVVAWERLAETCGNNLNKGSKILVDGRLQIRSYEANDGQKRRVAEVVAQSIEFLDNKKQAESGSSETIDVNSFGADIDPDEVPF
jgi:single-strand DNA-binding protein